MRTLLILATVLALGAQDQTPTFRATTRLVELTVTAVDKQGAPVTDLTLEEFTLQDNGTLRLGQHATWSRDDTGPSTSL